ncbi:MAG: hypothetical protein DCC68_08305 [Planctomycetota bacterium]|nr:MAG: hypothetical protein DCC68_08305 [Planctomycetota bacterium]
MRHVFALACFSVCLGGLDLETACDAAGTRPTKTELARSREWANVKFAGKKPDVEGLFVAANHDAVQANGRGGKALRIGGKQYARGLYCHAPSRIVVRLPASATRFQAVVGVDSNEQTSGGRGSVVFSLSAGGKTLCSSEVVREGTAAVPIDVDLGGATEFELAVADGGDGISCDQADWGDARATLSDGREIALGELPIFDEPPCTAELPFSFVYRGKASAALLPTWTVERESELIDEARTRHTVSYSDPETALQVRCVAVAYRDFPVVEWTVHLKNAGATATPLVENLVGLDAAWTRGSGGDCTVRHFVGSLAEARDYAPLTTPLQPGKSLRLASAGGRGSNATWPYFNLDRGAEGVIVAIGWPGQWFAEIARDDSRRVSVRAGQEGTRFKLLPGEEIRTPLIAVQFWEGDWIRAQNVWRRWMMAHNLPRPGGRAVSGQMAGCSSHQFAEMINANSQNQKQFIDRYVEERLAPDYWWMDAGWYPCDGQWPKTGTWEVDQQRFPGGLRPIADHAHAKGVKTIVWFEPERVAPGTWLAEQRPQWVLGGKGGGLLDLGNPEARVWLTDHVDAFIAAEGVDLYRQDFNMDPLGHWQANDVADRRGITENHHVAGYLAYWDELLRRHPQLLIDTCASGGRRNDLETLRRAVPLLRSDYILEPVGNQGHTYGLSFWVPFQGTGSGSRDVSAYVLRSTMLAHFTACFDARRRDLGYAAIRRLLEQWRSYREYYFGDYYPLTPYNLDAESWIAWQFDVPETGEGMIQAFRRDRSVYETARFPLRGVEPQSEYEVRNIDQPKGHVVSGRELLENGAAVTIGERPGAAVVVYRRVQR